MGTANNHNPRRLDTQVHKLEGVPLRQKAALAVSLLAGSIGAGCTEASEAPIKPVQSSTHSLRVERGDQGIFVPGASAAGMMSINGQNFIAAVKVTNNLGQPLENGSAVLYRINEQGQPDLASEVDLNLEEQLGITLPAQNLDRSFLFIGNTIHLLDSFGNYKRVQLADDLTAEEVAGFEGASRLMGLDEHGAFLMGEPRVAENGQNDVFRLDGSGFDVAADISTVPIHLPGMMMQDGQTPLYGALSFIQNNPNDPNRNTALRLSGQIDFRELDGRPSRLVTLDEDPNRVAGIQAMPDGTPLLAVQITQNDQTGIHLEPLDIVPEVVVEPPEEDAGIPDAEVDQEVEDMGVVDAEFDAETPPQDAGIEADQGEETPDMMAQDPDAEVDAQTPPQDASMEPDQGEETPDMMAQDPDAEVDGQIPTDMEDMQQILSNMNQNELEQYFRDRMEQEGDCVVKFPGTPAESPSFYINFGTPNHCTITFTDIEGVDEPIVLDLTHTGSEEGEVIAASTMVTTDSNGRTIFQTRLSGEGRFETSAEGQANIQVLWNNEERGRMAFISRGTLKIVEIERNGKLVYLYGEPTGGGETEMVLGILGEKKINKATGFSPTLAEAKYEDAVRTLSHPIPVEGRAEYHNPLTGVGQDMRLLGGDSLIIGGGGCTVSNNQPSNIPTLIALLLISIGKRREQ